MIAHDMRGRASLEDVVAERYDVNAITCEAFVVEWAAAHLAVAAGAFHAAREWRRVNERRRRFGRYTTTPAYGSALYVSYFAPAARNAGAR